MTQPRPLLIDLTGDDRDESSSERTIIPTASIIDLTGSAAPFPIAHSLQIGASTSAASSRAAGSGAQSQSEHARQRGARKRAAPRTEEFGGGVSSAAANNDERGGGDHLVICSCSCVPGHSSLS